MPLAGFVTVIPRKKKKAAKGLGLRPRDHWDQQTADFEAELPHRFVSTFFQAVRGAFRKQKTEEEE